MARHVDYETFQALVSAAHLRPLAGGLRLGGGGGGRAAALRAFRTDGSIVEPCTQVGGGTRGSRKVAEEGVLRSGVQFARAWRASPAAADRVALLRRAMGAGALRRLLRLELSTQLLQEMVACLDVARQADAAEDALAGSEGSSSTTRAEAAALAAAVLDAAAAAVPYGVARAGLSLQARQRLAALEAALAEHDV